MRAARRSRRRRSPAPRLREQLQHRRGDDAERALRADEQVLQVVAGVVLAQALEAVPDPPVGEHDLEAEHEVAGVAVAQDGRAAGIGREVAADAAGALGGEGEREQKLRPPAAASCTFCRMQPASTVMVALTGSTSRMRSSRARDSTTAAVRHAAADEAGIAALRHHRHAAPRRRRARPRRPPPSSPGRTTATASPRKSPRASVRCASMSAAAVRTCSGRPRAKLFDQCRGRGVDRHAHSLRLASPTARV